MTMTASHPTPTIPLNQREMLRAREVRAILNVRASKFRELLNGRLIPQPIVLAGVRMWRRRELLAWIDQDCPFVGRGDWRWTPSVEGKLIDVHTKLARDLAEMQAEWAVLDEMLKKGDQIVQLRRHQ